MGKRGFSLIELVIVVALLGGISLAISRIFFANLRGVEKTQLLLEVRQTGDQALVALGRKIRNARDVRVDIGGSVTDCDATGLSSNKIILTDPPVKDEHTGKITQTQTEFSCELFDIDPDPVTAKLIGRLRMRVVDVVNGTGPPDVWLTSETVDVAHNCSAKPIFTCAKTVDNPARVEISYTLRKANPIYLLLTPSPPNSKGGYAELDFDSTVSLRNF